MITLENDGLVVRAPTVHPDAVTQISFRRTLRIPDDGSSYPLPPGLGYFPLRHVDDFASSVPPNWLDRGGVMMPMHQAEAMWIYFSGRYPFALKIATGKICAITGENWTDHLNINPQNYVVSSRQPWLDGYCVEKGLVSQFVAMPLGEGYSAEEQITGDAEWGGIQVIAYPMKRECYIEIERQRERKWAQFDEDDFENMPAFFIRPPSMSLAPGGKMQQKIYEDTYGLDVWDQRHASRCFVSIANSEQWISVTGERPPNKSPTAKQYAKAGMPWFSYYGGDVQGLPGSEGLSKLISVFGMGQSKGVKSLPENESVDVFPIVRLGKQVINTVREWSSH